MEYSNVIWLSAACVFTCTAGRQKQQQHQIHAYGLDSFIWLAHSDCPLAWRVMSLRPTHEGDFRPRLAFYVLEGC